MWRAEPRLFQGCSELIQQVTDGEVEPSVRTAGSDVVEFAPYPLAPEKAGEEVQTFTSINQATDWYFQAKMAERLNSLKTNLMGPAEFTAKGLSAGYVSGGGSGTGGRE